MELHILEDEEIIDMFWKRQESAIYKAQEKYGRRIFIIAKNIFNSDEDAKECVNDTLLKAWQAIPPSKPRMLGAFLAKIARNLAINKWKAKNAKKRGGTETDLLLSELQDSIPDSGGIEQVHESKMVVKSINTCLCSMDKTSRYIFILRYFYCESIKNISNNLNINENNVKSKLFRARKLLKSQLEKEGITI